MAGIFDRLKKGADKAAFEADKLRRTTSVRSQINALGGQVNRKTRALGEKALELFDSGQLSQPALLETCEQITALRQQIAKKEAEIEAIRQETLPEEPVPALYGHICPNCKIQLLEEARFCPQCGGSAQDVPPPAPPEVLTGLVCSDCGETLVEGAAFCPNCGAKIEAQPPASAHVCGNCGTPLLEEAVFCPECGTQVEKPEPVSMVEEAEEAEESLDDTTEAE